MALTAQQRQAVLDYVRGRLQKTEKIPAYRAEYIPGQHNGKIVKIALPPNESVGTITINDKTVGVRIDKNGKVVYGHRVKLDGSKRNSPLPAEKVDEFIKAFGDLLRFVE